MPKIGYMKRAMLAAASRKTLLISTLVGALLGALIARGDLHKIATIPFFTLDHTLLGHKYLFKAGLVCWVIFGLYWEIASKNSAPATSSESKLSRAIHVTLTTVALVLEFAPIHGIGRLYPAIPAVMATGVGLETAGLAFAIWARRHLGQHWSGEITIKVDHELIQTGPYRLVRHPIYTGLLTMCLGTALLTGERLALLGLAMVFYAYYRKTRLEEANLNIVFGPRYDAYRSKTSAIIPGIY